MTTFVKLPILRGFTEIKKLYELMKDKNAYICGGYARYCCSSAKKIAQTDDVDIYCKDEETFNDLKKIFTDKEFENKHENEISVVFIPPVLFYPCPKINLIKPKEEFHVKTNGTVEEILENFDFTVTRIAIINENECIADEDFVEHEKMQILVIKNIHCPVSSALRFCKYYKKGYWSRPLQIMKLFINWDERGSDYKNRLCELLVKIEEDKNLTKKMIESSLDDQETTKKAETESQIQELYKIMMID